MFVAQIITHRMALEEFINISDWLNAFFSNKEAEIYYFMFVILGIYLTIPLLSLLTKNEYRKTLWLTILLFFVFISILPNICILFEINYNTNLSV